MTISAQTPIERTTEKNTVRSAAAPVTFSDTVGLFMPARGAGAHVGVLFVSPWGLEEMCLRKFWRVIADDLSDRGVASFRFDYPGTGDALDKADYSAGLRIWEDCAVAAAERLRSLSGCEKIIVVSQGLGSAIATRVAERVKGLEAIAYLAPVTSGRTYLREMQIWSRMVEEGLGVAKAHRAAEGMVIAGIEMPSEIAADIRKLDISAPAQQPASRCLVVKRVDRPTDAAFASKLRDLGAEVTEAEYQGYDDLISNPAMAVMPETVKSLIVDWISTIVGRFPGSVAQQESGPLGVPCLECENFRETPLRFGEHNRLYGVLCEPLGERRGATVVLLGTAYDRNAGWGRSGVSMARDLAARGIASLRFDCANVADSPPVPGVADQVLYDRAQTDDVVAALDLIERRDMLPAIVSGRCSGAYLAFRSAVLDGRVSGAVAVNPFVFYWDPSRDIDQFLRFVPRTLGDYKGRLFQVETFRRLIQGRVDVKRSLANIGRALWRRVARHAVPVVHLLPENRALRREVVNAFRDLSDRNVAVSLIYSENDVGLDHFAEQFGTKGKGLRRYANASLTILEGADHNLTPEPARRAYLESVADMALSQSEKA